MSVSSGPSQIPFCEWHDDDDDEEEEDKDLQYQNALSSYYCETYMGVLKSP